MTATPLEPPPGLPFSQACENNKAPILAVLAQAFADRRHVLEIGSGTGQHGVHFAPRLPHLVWQTSDLAENHAGIRAWHALHPAPNLRPPLLLDLQGGDWPPGAFDAVFTSNTTHIVAWPLGRIDIQTPPSLPIAACQARREEGAGGTSNRRATTPGRPLWATLRAKALGSPRRRYSPLVYPDTRRGSRLAVDCPGPWRRGCLNVDSP